MTMSAHLAGVIVPGMVPDIMQLLSRNNDATGILTLDTGLGRAEVWFRGGQLICATYGAWKDDNAIRKLLRVREGYFAFVVRKQTPRRTIHRSVESLLLDCYREFDEDGEDCSGSPTEFMDLEPEVDAERPGKPVEQLVDRDKGRAAWFEPTKQISAIVLLLVLLGVEAVMITRSVNPIVEENNRVREASSRDNAVRSHLVAGNRMLQSGNHNEALAAFDNALKVEPGNSALPMLVDSTREIAALLNAFETSRQRGAELETKLSQLEKNLQNLQQQYEYAQNIAAQANALISDDRPDEAILMLQTVRNNMESNPYLLSLVDNVSRLAELRKAQIAQASAQRNTMQQATRMATAGDDARKKGDIETAQEFYDQAKHLSGGTLDLSVQLSNLNAHSRVRDQLKATEVYSFEVLVSSSVVVSHTVSGQALDFYITAGAGPMRIGEIDPFGKVKDLYYQNPSQTPEGSATFTVNNQTFAMRWDQVRRQQRRGHYIIAVALQPAPQPPDA